MKIELTLVATGLYLTLGVYALAYFGDGDSLPALHRKHIPLPLAALLVLVLWPLVVAGPFWRWARERVHRRFKL